MKLWSLSLFAILALSACGNGNDDNIYGSGVQAGGLPPVQGYCAPEVVDAYNAFATGCQVVQSQMQVQVCRMKAEHFVRLYPGISCVAVPPQGGFDQGFGGGQFFNQYQGQQVFHITDIPMRQLLASLGQFGQDPGWQQRHRRYPRVGHRPGQGFPGGHGNGFPNGPGRF